MTTKSKPFPICTGPKNHPSLSLHRVCVAECVLQSVCCRVCVAECVLQRVCCRVCVAESVLQRVCCRVYVVECVLQRVCCRVYICISTIYLHNFDILFFIFHCVAACCSVLQCVAVCCSVLQCVAVCCSVVLQCVAVCCSTFLIFHSSYSRIWRDVMELPHISSCEDMHIRMYEATPSRISIFFTTILYSCTFLILGGEDA